MFRLSRLSRFLVILIVLLSVGLTTSFWLPQGLRLIGIVNINTDTIQGVESFLQIGILVIGTLLGIGRWLFIKGKENQVHPTTSQNNPSQHSQSSKYSVNSEYTGAVGDNTTVNMTINEGESSKDIP